MIKLIAMETKLHNKNSYPEDDRTSPMDSYKKASIRKIRKKFTKEEKYLIVKEGQSGQMSISDICRRERISPATFYQWSVEFLQSENLAQQSTLFVSKIKNDSDRFKVVIEGKSGETSVKEILKRENISHETFLQWCRDFSRYRQKLLQTDSLRQGIYESYKRHVNQISGKEAFNFIAHYIDFTIDNQIVVLNGNDFKFKSNYQADSVLCLQKINYIGGINPFFEKVNDNLPLGGIFVGCLETLTARMDRLDIYKVPVLSKFYFGMEFIFRRILPKLSLTRSIFSKFTKGKYQLLSKAEGLGRLVSCGFKIIDYKTIDGLVYFVVKKEKEPYYDNNPSYGLIYTTPRIGNKGKLIQVYKFRTMHPYSEYLQDYIIRVNGYSNSGKPAEDFRIPAWGKIMRRYWIDEIPQLVNLFKGEMKLIGVRPVSQRYFQDIPKEMQKLRLTQKPGCIPPVIALNRGSNVMGVLQAEKEYIEEKIKYPYFTDIKYFLKAIFNIIFKHKRSS